MLERLDQLIKEVLNEEPSFDTEGLLVLVVDDHWEDPLVHKKEGEKARRTYVVHKSMCHDLKNKWDTYEVWTYNNNVQRLFKTTRGFEEVKNVPYRRIYKDTPEWVQVTKEFN